MKIKINNNIDNYIFSLTKIQKSRKMQLISNSILCLSMRTNISTALLSITHKSHITDWVMTLGHHYVPFLLCHIAQAFYKNTCYIIQSIILISYYWQIDGHALYYNNIIHYSYQRAGFYLPFLLRKKIKNGKIQLNCREIYRYHVTSYNINITSS
jgi:hypothetical protein